MLDFEAFYLWPLSDRVTATSSALLRTEPGHVAGAERDAALMFRLQSAF